MTTYITKDDVDPRRSIADYQIHNVINEAIEYLEKEGQKTSVHGSQTAQLVAMHLRAYADMIDKFAADIEATEEEERMEVKEALKLKDKYHFQGESVSAAK